MVQYKGIEMPHNAILYALASSGTILAGVTYKLRQKDELKWHEWLILSISLAVWGVVSFGIIVFAFPEHDIDQTTALMAIPLGVGISETFAFAIAAAQRVVVMLPDSIRELILLRRNK